MKLSQDELRDVIRSQTARNVTAPPECLSEEVLMRAAARELDAVEREQVASHLAGCTDCVRNYRIAHSVKLWAEQIGLATGADESDSMLGQTMATGLSLSNISPKTRASRRYRRSAYFPVAGYAIAASAIIAAVLAGWLALLHRSDGRELARLNAELADRDRTVGQIQQSLAEAQRSGAAGAQAPPGSASPGGAKPGTNDEARIASLEETIAGFSRPQFNVPIVDLEASRARGTGDGSTTVIEVPRTANQFTLILHTSGESPHAGYLFEITGDGGKLIFRGPGMKNTRENGLTVALSRHLMPAGRYSIKLYGPGAKGAEPSEQYALEVRYR